MLSDVVVDLFSRPPKGSVEHTFVGLPSGELSSFVEV
jgi:hypothetical protein